MSLPQARLRKPRRQPTDVKIGRIGKAPFLKELFHAEIVEQESSRTFAGCELAIPFKKKEETEWPYVLSHKNGNPSQFILPRGSSITNGRRYCAGDERRKQYQSSHDDCHVTFRDPPAFMAAGKVENSECFSTGAPSRKDSFASSSAGVPFSGRTVSNYSAWRTLDTFDAEDSNTKDGPGQNIRALDRALPGIEKEIQKPVEAKMQGRHRTYDDSGLPVVAAGFGGLECFATPTTPRKSTYTGKKLPRLSAIKIDLPSLTAAALAAHEASCAEENSEGCDMTGMSPSSPRSIELKVRQEAKERQHVITMLEPKRKTKEELDAEFRRWVKIQAAILIKQRGGEAV
jgi:hypothetical protein